MTSPRILWKSCGLYVSKSWVRDMKVFFPLLAQNEMLHYHWKGGAETTQKHGWARTNYNSKNESCALCFATNTKHTHSPHTTHSCHGNKWGLPDLDDFANVFEDELARWSKNQVLCTCFAFGRGGRGGQRWRGKASGPLATAPSPYQGEFPSTILEERERGPKFRQVSDEHSSPIPYKCNMYEHRVFRPYDIAKHSALVMSDATLLFGAGVFDRPPITISQSEGLNLSNLLDEVANSP